MPGVLIFRKQILPYSETFIADQGRFLPTYTPYFVGFQRNSSGASLLKNSEVIVLEQYTSLLGLQKLKFRLGMQANQAWLSTLIATKSDLIHAHFATDAVDAMRLSESLGIPFVATVHGYDITKSGESKSYLKKRKQMFRQASKIIAVSKFIESQLIEKGCPNDLIIQHYIGIDVGKFSGDKVESDVPTILFIGRLVEKKGCTYLLEAASRLKSSFPDLLVNIVGTGPLQASLEQQAKDASLRVNFLGAQTPEQIKKLMLESWVFSTPSITAVNGNAEGLGMVFLEAQALRTPVVSFKSGGVVEAVEDGVSGLLCNEKDVDKLTDNLRILLADKQERINFGDNGRQRVVEKFNIVEQCKSLELIYNSVTR